MLNIFIGNNREHTFYYRLPEENLPTHNFRELIMRRYLCMISNSKMKLKTYRKV